jgi:hypothetical protein
MTVSTQPARIPGRRVLELQQMLDDGADARARRPIEDLAQVIDLLDQMLQIEVAEAAGAQQSACSLDQA